MAENNDAEYKKLLDSLKTEIHKLREENHRQQESLGKLQGVVDKLRASVDRNATKETKLTKTVKFQVMKEEIDSIFKTETNVNIQQKLWLSPSNLKSIPAFIPVSKRPVGSNNVSTRFISFINFKGGVGKTTLVANVGAAFAEGLYDTPGTKKSRPLRVLLVDLDFQGTLTDRCVLIDDLSRDKTDLPKSSADLLSEPPSTNKLNQLIYPFIGSENAKVIPGIEALDTKDSESFMRLACKLVDTRFYYRLWFHKRQALSQFDLVIFDCPPRLTASSVCALTVSDFAFIPISADLFDTRSVVRTCTFINRFSTELNIPCQIGGLILNRTSLEKNLSGREKNIVDGIRNLSKVDLPKELPILKTFVPRRSGDKNLIGNIGEPIPCLNPDRPFPFVNDLASEIYSRIYQ